MCHSETAASDTNIRDYSGPPSTSVSRLIVAQRCSVLKFNDWEHILLTLLLDMNFEAKRDMSFHGGTFTIMNSDPINSLYHKNTSYKTRHSSYGEPTSCMEGTRVKILADLEAWAMDDTSSKVLWLVGMAGTASSALVHPRTPAMHASSSLPSLMNLPKLRLLSNLRSSRPLKSTRNSRKPPMLT